MIVDEFIQWLTTAGPVERATAACPLVRAWLGADVDPAIRDGLEAVMTVYLDDSDATVRAALAEALAGEPAAPHPVVLALAQDRPEVAAPLIARSPVLLDAELVDLVAVGGPEIQVAAALRPAVGPGLAAAIAEVGDPAALAALLRNRQAAIPTFSLRRMVERAAAEAEVRAAILARPGVPIDVRQSLLLEMSVAYQDQILARSDMREDQAAMITRDAKDKATVALAAGAEEAEMRPLVEHLRATGQLTTTLMLRAACMGNIAFVREALSLLTGQPSGRVTALIAEGREGAIRALYRKSGMAERAYPVFAAAIEVNRELAGSPEIDDQRFARTLIERVIARAAGGAEADDLIVLLRRFAAEAARDAARAYVARTLARPAALAAPTEAEATLASEDTGDLWSGEEATVYVPAEPLAPTDEAEEAGVVHEVETALVDGQFADVQAGCEAAEGHAGCASENPHVDCETAEIATGDEAEIPTTECAEPIEASIGEDSAFAAAIGDGSEADLHAAEFATTDIEDAVVLDLEDAIGAAVAAALADARTQEVEPLPDARFVDEFELRILAELAAMPEAAAAIEDESATAGEPRLAPWTVDPPPQAPAAEIPAATPPAAPARSLLDAAAFEAAVFEAILLDPLPEPGTRRGPVADPLRRAA